MRHIYKLGRTCRNCSHARTDEDGLYCVHDQWIGGWEYTRNPRNRAMKCQRFINEKHLHGEWKNNEVFFPNYTKIVMSPNTLIF